MRRSPNYQNRYQRRRAKRLARHKGTQPQRTRPRPKSRGALFLRLLVRAMGAFR